MSILASSLLASTPGKLAVRLAQPFVHKLRRARHPDIPVDHMMTNAEYRGQKFAIEHRRWNEGDKAAVEQCFNKAQYDFPKGPHGEFLERVYEKILSSKRIPLIVDCGANIGASVLWFTARYPKAHIVAVEPAPANFALLKKNCGEFGVDCRQAGIAAEEGSAYLASRINDMGFHLSTEVTSEKVELISMSTILRDKPETEYVPFLLKIDIEGAESDLFTGDLSMLQRFPLIVIELHDWLLPGQGSSFAFFRFHAEMKRDFCMNNENVASIAMPQAI
jgi:FkbM family methyltransferase